MYLLYIIIGSAGELGIDYPNKVPIVQLWCRNDYPLIYWSYRWSSKYLEWIHTLREDHIDDCILLLLLLSDWFSIRRRTLLGTDSIAPWVSLQTIQGTIATNGSFIIICSSSRIITIYLLFWWFLSSIHIAGPIHYPNISSEYHTSRAVCWRYSSDRQILWSIMVPRPQYAQMYEQVKKFQTLSN